MPNVVGFGVHSFWRSNHTCWFDILFKKVGMSESLVGSVQCGQAKSGLLMCSACSGRFISRDPSREALNFSDLSVALQPAVTQCVSTRHK